MYLQKYSHGLSNFIDFSIQYLLTNISSNHGNITYVIFLFLSLNSCIHHQDQIFPLHFNKFLDENLSISSSFSHLLLVVIPSWYHTLPSIPIIWDVKWKSAWYTNPLMFRPTVSPSCPNCKDLLTVTLLKLMSKTNTLGIDLKHMGCIIAEKQDGHFS